MSDDEAHNTPGGSSWLTSAERHIDRDALLRLQMPPGPAAPQGECEGERNNSRSRLVPLPPRKRSLSAENLLSKTSAPRLSRPQSSPFPLQPPKHTRDDTASQPHSSSSSGFLRALPSSRPPLNGDDAARPPRPPALNGIATLLPPPVPSPGDTRREGGGKDGEELVMRMRSSGVTLEGAGGGGVYRVGQEGTEISAAKGIISPKANGEGESILKASPSHKKAPMRRLPSYVSRASHSSTMSTKQLRDHIRLKRDKDKQKAEHDQTAWPDPRKYNARSVYLFTLNNPTRKLLIRGLENPWWDRIVLSLIFLNTVQLLITDPLDVPAMRPVSQQREIMEGIGLFFTWVFTVECFLKVIALGFIMGHGSYLSNSWNWLDFFIVCVGMIEILIPNAGNLTSLRALRVMRPLRAITRFPELQALVVLLLNCIPQLSNVVILLLFIFFVFGILGVQLFKGCFRGRCFALEDGLNTGDMCSLATNGGMSMCGDGRECLQLGQNSGRGNVRFDDIGGAVSSIFQLMTTEGWADMMYETQDTVGRWVFVYYVVIMFAGPLCAVNLFLVVMSEQFAKSEEAKKRADERERQLAESASTLADRVGVAADAGDGFGPSKLSEGKTVKEEAVKHKAAVMNRARRQSVSGDESQHDHSQKTDESQHGLSPQNRRGSGKGQDESQTSIGRRHISVAGGGLVESSLSPTGRRSSRKVDESKRRSSIAFTEEAQHGSRKVEEVFTRRNSAPDERNSAPDERNSAPDEASLAKMPVVKLRSITPEKGVGSFSTQSQAETQAETSGDGVRSITSDDVVRAYTPLPPPPPSVSDGNASPFSPRGEGSGKLVVSGMSPRVLSARRQGSSHSGNSEDQSSGDGSPGGEAEQERQRKKKPILRRIQWHVRILAKSDFLQNFVQSIIVFNTVAMASDFKCEFDGTDDYCPYYKAMLECCNVFFAIVFTVELLIKVIGLGPRGYASSKMNLFDALIVIVSDVELIQANAFGTIECFVAPCVGPAACLDCMGEGGGFAVLRAFRLVRLVKLLRAFPDMQKQVKVLGEVMGSIVWLMVLVCILVLIFFVLGMNLFGGQVAAPWDPGDLPIGLGAYVWVRFPGDDAAPPLGRYGRVEAADFDGKPSTPWLVNISFAADAQNQALFQGSLGINPEGQVWCATQDDIDAGMLGMPYISSLPIRLSFDSWWLAGITTFQLITMANWNDNLYDVTGSLGGAGYALYFYALITIGNWMLLNLFIAILIQKFAEQKAVALAENMFKMHDAMVAAFGDLTEDEVYSKAEDLFDSYDKSGDGEIDKYEFRDALLEIGVELGQRELIDLVNQYDSDNSGAIDFSEFFCMIMQLLEESRKVIIAAELAAAPVAQLPSALITREMSRDSSTETAGGNAERPVIASRTNTELKHGMTMTLDTGRIHAIQIKRAESFKILRAEQQLNLPRTCWVFGDKNPLRVLCRSIAQSKILDQLVLLAIGVSCVCLVVERPDIGDNSPERAVLKVVDLVLNSIFTLEFCVKVMDQTFSTYIKSGWNKLDFLIVSTSAIDVIVTYALAGQDVDLGAIKIFRVFRIFRALRPLRIIARMRGLRILIGTLLSAVKPVAQTCAIAGGVFLVGGILGMQFLMGKMDACSDGEVQDQGDCVGLDGDGEVRSWDPYYVNFDNTYRSMISMFLIATQDDWVSHMWAGIDATAARKGPVQNASPGLSLFYIGMIFASGMVVINIFVGVFVDCYLAASAEMDASADPDLKEKRPKVKRVFNDPTHGLKKMVFDVVEHQKFDMFIAFFIVTNVISMAFDSFKPSEWQQDFDLVANYFFSLIFGWECVAKMYSLNSRRYFTSGWNKFDFFIVMVSFAGVFIDSLGNAVPINPTVLRILRIFRIFRILRAFRIFKSLKGLQQIVMTLASSLPAIMNLFSFLLLLFFIYSILGVMVFGAMCKDGDQGFEGLYAVRCMLSPEDLLLDPHATFETVAWSLLTLFRVATGDAWGDILDQVAAVAPHGAGSRPVLDTTWTVLTDLLGADPASVYPPGDPFLTQFGLSAVETGMTRGSASALDIAKVAIWHWNATSHGQEESWDWPYPTGHARGWIVLARMALPTCLHSEETMDLQKVGLMDCKSTDGYDLSCSTTCGVEWVANIYFMTFYIGASFVLLQLVIAVLMEQLIGNGEVQEAPKIPGCETLGAAVFARMFNKWQLNARFKIKMLRRREARRAGGAVARVEGGKVPPDQGNKVAPVDDSARVSREEAQGGGGGGGGEQAA